MQEEEAEEEEEEAEEEEEEAEEAEEDYGEIVGAHFYGWIPSADVELMGPDPCAPSPHRKRSKVAS